MTIEKTIYKAKKPYLLLLDEQGEILFNKYTWYINSKGYLYRFHSKDDGKIGAVYFHRELMRFPQRHVDHKDGNKLNNQSSNLRECSKEENNRNSTKQANKTSSYKGVSLSWNRHAWRASILVNGKQKHLGYFKTEIEAAQAYDKQALISYRAFARLNFPIKDSEMLSTDYVI